MTYYACTVAAVPTANRQKYIEHVHETWPYFQRLGATRMVEGWGVDVTKGKVTDFYRATKAEDGEITMFSWAAWADRATCDAAAKAMEASME